MKKLILMITIISSLGTISTEAATTYDVRQYNRASQYGIDAIKSKNYERAFEQLQKASMLGNKVSQYALAILYMQGLGVKKDYNEAYLWLNVAAEKKDKKWRGLRDKVHNAMTQEQVLALKPQVAEYIKKYGAETQEVSCYKRAATGSNRKLMQCSKYLTPGY